MKISIILLFLFACNSTPNQEVIKEAPQINDADTCVCMEMYAPVCYKGKNYSNSCFAACEGAKEGDFTQGECP